MVDSAINAGLSPSGSGPEGERIVGFWGRRGPLFGILVKNALLGLITLGIYRFWARTRLRRYFWNSIEIDGDQLEYTGRGLELFIGFLIVVAVLAPLLIAYQFLSAFLQTNAPELFFLVTFLYVIGLLWLTRYAYFRARRYRLARTVWRGIRGGQDGSAAVYASLWFGYAVLSILTLGWAVPWMTAALQEYEVENARFGVENFRYEGDGKALLKRWVPCGALWTIAILGVFVSLIANWVELQDLFASATQIDENTYEFGDSASARLGSFFAVSWIAYILSIPFYIFYRIGALRYMINASNLSDVEFASEFSGWRLVGYGALNFIALVVIVFIIILIFSAVGAVAALSTGDVANTGFMMTSLILSFIPIILLLLFVPMINLLLFYYPAIRHIATTLRLSDISSLGRIVQSSKDDPRFGEGLAAAMDLDVGGF